VLSPVRKVDDLGEEEIRLPESLADRCKAKVGDLVYIEDERRWLGGLKSVHAKLAGIAGEGDGVQLSSDLIDRGRFDLDRQVRVSKVF
ncbi:MAG: hypothetical protein KC978_15860, partial [Candidatus Omnitrophica bacterium]|nr:hypothetical protein [Candidatus Omnitrophota bacterium]